MTATELIQRVKVRLNRLDTSFNADMRNEEVLLYINSALQSLVNKIYNGRIDNAASVDALSIYLSTLKVLEGETPLTNNGVSLEDVLVFIGAEVYVSIGEFSAWVPGVEGIKGISIAERESNPFTKSTVDNPTYDLLNNKCIFVSEGFTCTKVKREFIKKPEEILESSTVDFRFLNELEEEATTLILENIQDPRISSQPQISKS